MRRVIDYTKPREPLLERIFQVTISVPMLNLIFMLTKSKILPYLLTFLMFVFGIFGSFLLLNHNYIASAVAFIIFIALDKADGTSARFIFGKDPELRGTLDFVLGHIVGVVYIISFLIILIKNGLLLETYAMLLLIGLFMVFLGLQSTKFRLFSLYNLSEEKKFDIIRLRGIYGKIWRLATKSGIKPFPTECDGFVLLQVFLPLVGFSYALYFIVVAILFTLIEIFVLIFIISKAINFYN